MTKWFLSLSYVGLRMSMIGAVVLLVGVGDHAGRGWFGVGYGLVAGGLLTTALTPWGTRK
jgi:hypothetical protein